MPDPAYGPDKPCRRTPCIDAHQAATGPEVTVTTGDHLGGAHLDPTDRDRYDGLRALAMPGNIRAAVRPLMQHVAAYDRPRPDDTELRVAVDVALDACFREIDRLRQQVAHVQVDADRRVRDASRRVADCDDHGHLITALEQQVTGLDRARDQTEKARLALLGQHHAIGEWLEQRRAAQAAGAQHDVRADEIADAFAKLHAKTSRAHQRAYTERKDTA